MKQKFNLIYTQFFNVVLLLFFNKRLWFLCMLAPSDNVDFISDTIRDQPLFIGTVTATLGACSSLSMIV